MQKAVNESVTGNASEEEEYAAYRRVGRRQRFRTQKDAMYGSRGDNGGRVPADRAMVLAGSTRRVWER